MGRACGDGEHLSLSPVVAPHAFPILFLNRLSSVFEETLVALQDGINFHLLFAVSFLRRSFVRPLLSSEMDDFRIKAALILFLIINFMLFRQPGERERKKRVLEFDTPRSVFKKEPSVHKCTGISRVQTMSWGPLWQQKGGFEIVGFSVKDLKVLSNSVRVPMQLPRSATPNSTTFFGGGGE